MSASCGTSPPQADADPPGLDAADIDAGHEDGSSDGSDASLPGDTSLDPEDEPIDVDDPRDLADISADLVDASVSPCLASPGQLVFPSTIVGRNSVNTFVISNLCDIEIEVLTGLPESSQFSVSPVVSLLEPSATAELRVSFFPIGTGEVVEAMELSWSSGRPDAGAEAVQLSGSGVANSCPTASLGCRIYESEGTPATGRLCVPPLSLVECFGDADDLDGTVVDYSWAVERLNDDLSNPTIHSEVPESIVFQAEYEGEYQVGLTVLDDLGESNCEAAILTLSVRGCF